MMELNNVSRITVDILSERRKNLNDIIRVGNQLAKCSSNTYTSVPYRMQSHSM